MLFAHIKLMLLYLYVFLCIDWKLFKTEKRKIIVLLQLLCYVSEKNITILCIVCSVHYSFNEIYKENKNAVVEHAIFHIELTEEKIRSGNVKL